MRIAELSKRIDLQAPTKIGDVTTFVSVLPAGTLIAAAIWPISANEIIQANAPVMIASHRVRIRYRSVLKANFRIVYAGRNFNIVSIVDPNMAHKFLDILVKEATS